MPLPVLLCYHGGAYGRGDPFSRLAPSGLLCLHGFLRDQGYDSVLMNLSTTPWKRIPSLIAEAGPALVGVSHFTYNHDACARLYGMARKAAPEAVIVGGGAQATFLDRELLQLFPGLDLVVRGEGEFPLLEIAARLARGSRNWRGIPGVSRREGTRVVRERMPGLAEDIDAFYTPARFSASHGIKPEEQYPFLSGGRGCPRACRFCGAPRLWGRTVRHRSLAGLLGELRFLQKEHRLTYVSFRDDSFAEDPAWVRELCGVLVREGPYLGWACQARPESLTGPLLREMKLAGCETVQFGLETSVPRLQRFLGKELDLGKVKTTLSLCRRNGIRASGYFICGIPGQTRREAEADARFIRQEFLQDAVIAPLCVYPGTALAAELARQGDRIPERFLSGLVADLVVRSDPEAVGFYGLMSQAAEEACAHNVLGRREIEGLLAESVRCFSALVDLGRLCLAEGEVDRARAAFREIAERNPRNPVGYAILAELEAEAENLSESRKCRHWLQQTLKYL